MKYELVKDDFKTVSKIKVYRIRAIADFGDVKAGDLGGYVSDEYCLVNDLEDTSWIDSDSLVIYSTLSDTKVIHSTILNCYIKYSTACNSNLYCNNIKNSNINNCYICNSNLYNSKKYNEIIHNYKDTFITKVWLQIKDKLKKIAKNISNIICFFIAGIALYTASAAFFGIVTTKEALYILLSSACILYLC